jgi:hypothetical protein
MRSSHPAVQSARRLETARRLEGIRRSDPVLRSRQVGTRAWALARAVPVDGEALTVILAVLADDEAETGTSPTTWTSARVVDVVWRACPLWGLRHGVAIPRAATDALRVWWARLDDEGGFGPGSDELAALEETLATHTGRSSVAAASRHPSVTGGSATRAASGQHDPSP